MKGRYKVAWKKEKRLHRMNQLLNGAIMNDVWGRQRCINVSLEGQEFDPTNFYGGKI